MTPDFLLCGRTFLLVVFIVRGCKIENGVPFGDVPEIMDFDYMKKIQE